MSEAPVLRATADAHLLPEEVYRRALDVGRRSAGLSGPNPPVGCLVVRDGHVVGEGATRPVGGAHAEVVALEAAGSLTAGAILVVTLEPCAHQGRTPPCSDAILNAGIAEVHVLHRDPDPVAAGGNDRLRAVGIRVVEVDAGLPGIAAAAAHDLRGFVARVRHGRPHVHLKLAQDVHGRTAASSGRYLTGPEARRRVHAVREDVDAVLIGGGTVRADDPQLDVRHVATDAQPRPVVLSVSADLPVDAVVIRPGALVLTAEGAPQGRSQALSARGAEVQHVPLSEHGLDLRAALRALLDHRILTVLAEPGPRLAEALLVHDLVDVIELHVANGAGVPDASIRPAVPAIAPLFVPGALVERRTTSDGDLLLRAEVVRDGSGGSVTLHGAPTLAEVR